MQPSVLVSGACSRSPLFGTAAFLRNEIAKSSGHHVVLIKVGDIERCVGGQLATLHLSEAWTTAAMASPAALAAALSVAVGVIEAFRVQHVIQAKLRKCDIEGTSFTRPVLFVGPTRRTGVDGDPPTTSLLLDLLGGRLVRQWRGLCGVSGRSHGPFLAQYLDHLQVQRWVRLVV